MGADNKKIGKAAGEWIVKRLGGKGRVVELMGLMTSTPGQDRHSGFREGITGSGIEIVFEADMNWLEPHARKEMESALARFDKIDLVFAHNDPGAHGAYIAAKAAGRANILFVGIDALPHEGVAYVEQGILDATFQYPTGGAEAIATALSIPNGEPVMKEIVLEMRLFEKPPPTQAGQGNVDGPAQCHRTEVHLAADGVGIMAAAREGVCRPGGDHPVAQGYQGAGLRTADRIALQPAATARRR